MKPAPARIQQEQHNAIPSNNATTASDLIHAEMAAEWMPKETAVRLAISLERSVLRVLEDLRPCEWSDWAKLQQTFQCCFGHRDRQEAMCKELAT